MNEDRQESRATHGLDGVAFGLVWRTRHHPGDAVSCTRLPQLYLASDAREISWGGGSILVSRWSALMHRAQIPEPHSSACNAVHSQENVPA